jgi:hypothetical protein
MSNVPVVLFVEMAMRELWPSSAMAFPWIATETFRSIPLNMRHPMQRLTSVDTGFWFGTDDYNTMMVVLVRLYVLMKYNGCWLLFLVAQRGVS